MELDRRIELRRDATRAPDPGPEWQRATAVAVAPTRGLRLRRALTYARPKMVLTTGATLGLWIPRRDEDTTGTNENVKARPHRMTVTLTITTILVAIVGSVSTAINVWYVRQSLQLTKDIEVQSQQAYIDVHEVVLTHVQTERV